MPFFYQPAGSPGTRLGEARLTREALESINKNLEKQNELLGTLIKQQTKKTGSK